MKKLNVFVCLICLGLTTSQTLAGQSSSEQSADVKLTQLVDTRILDIQRNGGVLDAATLAGYQDIIVKPLASVEFRKDWRRDLNQGRRAIGGHMSKNKYAKVKLEIARYFDKRLVTLLTKRSEHRQVTEAAQGPYLIIEPRLENINLIDESWLGAGGPRHIYNAHSKATLVLEARDSETGEIVGVIKSKRRYEPMTGFLEHASFRRQLDRFMSKWTRNFDENLDTLMLATEEHEA